MSERWHWCDAEHAARNLTAFERRTLLLLTRLPLIRTWPIECPVREPVTRIPSPIAPVTVNPRTATLLDLTVIPARHGALPGPNGPFWSHSALAVGDPWITAPFCPTSLSGAEMTTSSL